MNLTEAYSGKNTPFEGDLTLWLRSLPAGARITRAAVTLTPVAAAGGELFRETIRFTGRDGELGSRQLTDDNGIEVDFHARRTLAAVSGSPGTAVTANLQVDIGGAFLAVATDGTFNPPPAWQVVFGGASAQTALPGLAVTRFRLHHAAASFFLDSVTIRSAPSNLQLRLGQMAPFWVRLGELTQPGTSPDFAEVLNFFLTDAEVANGFYQVPLVIHSDTLARLDITLDIRYLMEVPVLPPHLSEVNLPYDFSTLPTAEKGLLSVRLPRDAVPVRGRTRAAVLGTFEPTRLALGDPGETPSAGALTVSPRCSLAQPVTTGSEISLTGVDLPLANTRPGLAGLNVSLAADADGKPSGEVLIEAEVKVGKPLPDGTVWGSAALPEPFRILPGARYWLVLQSRQGEAFWGVAPGSTDQPTLQCSRDGGLSWRAATGPNLKPPLGALFRFRHIPERFTMPVQLQIGEGPDAIRRRLDEFAPAGKVDFSFDFADKLEDHLKRPGSAPSCTIGPALCNPDFAHPRPRDATRRLFGRDTDRSWQITGTVDLSRGINLSHERFIVLSLDDSPPRRIDCAGADPARTGVTEIIAAINRAVGAEVAELAPPMSTTATKTDKRLQLTTPYGEGIVTLHPWCERGLPDCWDGTAGRIHRTRLDEGEGFALILADDDLMETGFAFGDYRFDLPCYADETPPPSTDPGALLRQRFPVSPRCRYRMALSHQVLAASAEEGDHACRPEALAAPSWEIEWFDADGNSLGDQSDHLPVAPPDKGRIAAEPAETPLSPPDNAAEAELRIRHPASAGYGLAIRDLNLTATAQAVQNGDFSRWEAGAGQNVPADWQVESGWIDRAYGQGVRLRGDGPEEAVMVQSAPVDSDAEYRLTISAVTGGPAVAAENLPAAERARLELVWRKGDDPVGEPITIPLDDPAFPTKGWQGTTPRDAERADLRLVQPQGEVDLTVTAVRFEKQDLTDVPLTFLGESPGQLKVSDLKVVYDRPSPSVPPAPARTAVALQPAPSGSTIARGESALARQPVAGIAGVGNRYREILENQPSPVRTIGDLAAMDATEEIEGIPLKRRTNLKTSAELVLEYADQVAMSSDLADEPLSVLISKSPGELARRSGGSVAEADRLVKGLRVLQRFLAPNTFDEMRLSDIGRRTS